MAQCSYGSMPLWRNTLMAQQASGRTNGRGGSDVDRNFFLSDSDGVFLNCNQSPASTRVSTMWRIFQHGQHLLRSFVGNCASIVCMHRNCKCIQFRTCICDCICNSGKLFTNPFPPFRFGGRNISHSCLPQLTNPFPPCRCAGRNISLSFLAQCLVCNPVVFESLRPTARHVY